LTTGVARGATTGGPVLLGDQTVEAGVDQNSAGWAEAFPFSGASSGNATSISVYIDPANSAKTLVAGIYSDKGGHPGSLLGSGSLSSPKAGAWNVVSVTGIAVSAGSTYWIAVLATSGTLYFRDRTNGSCLSENSAQTSLTALPSSWTSGPQYNTCPISAYAQGTAATSPQSPPSNTSAPVVSGSAVQGQTLSTSNGVWSGSPTSYTYAWRDCDSAGANCTAISGATSSAYTLQSSDVGHTVRAVVTATNSAGSTSASSAATATVTAPPGPTAAFSYSPAAPVTGQTVSFDGSSSSCPDAPCTYSWADDPPSGGSWALGSGQTITFTFSVAGTKYVTLTATDAAGRTARIEHDVVVTASSSGAPTDSSAPTISGTTQQGDMLTSSTGSWTGSPTSYAYQWQDCNSSGASCANISGATGSSYMLGSSDVGHTMRAMVTASNSSGSSTAGSAPTAMVTSSSGGAAPSNTALPVITGTATQGSVLSTSNGSWNGSPTSYTYAWQDCDSSGNNCSNISGATASTYTLAGSDVGHTIRSVVTAHNASGATPASSTQTAVVASSGSTSCNLNATPSNFSSQVSAASAGQTICLASGNYGTWNGVNKAVTITAASGASPQMVIAFGSGDGGFTLDHIANLSGTIFGGSNITIQNSTFSSASCTIGCLDIEGSMSNVVINHDTFSYPYQSTSSGPNSKVFLDTSGSSPGAAVTLENSYFANGDLDGIHFGGGSGDLVKDNFFANFCDRNVNHTDNMQFEGGTQIAIQGNYIYTPGPTSSSGCVAGGIVSYDGGTNGVLIENNVVDTTRDWGIELYSDQSSIVEHNTVVYHPQSYSAFNSGDGQIDIDRKSQDPAGTGTHVYDNVATVDFTNGSTGTADHNTNPSTVSYASPCSSGCTYGSTRVHDNYLLAAGSPGVGAADNGTNTGIYAAGW
jgi:hypothetical protein